MTPVLTPKTNEITQSKHREEKTYRYGFDDRAHQLLLQPAHVPESRLIIMQRVEQIRDWSV